MKYYDDLEQAYHDHSYPHEAYPYKDNSDIVELVGPIINNKKNMGIGILSWVNIKSALVSGLITAVLAMAGYIIGVGDIFQIDVHQLVNVGALSALTAVVSVIKSFFTTEKGNFVGSVKVTE